MLGKRHLPILIIIAISGFMRFYNLLHDYPHFFNPDERNMAIATSQIRLPREGKLIWLCLIKEFTSKDQQIIPVDDIKPSQPIGPHNCTLNPHFFAYGQFPFYLAFVSDQLVKYAGNIFSLIFPSNIVSSGLQSKESAVLLTIFPAAIFWLRFWSALSSTVTVYIVYLILKDCFNTARGNLITYLPTLTVAFAPGLIQAAHFGTTESLLTLFFIMTVHLTIKLLYVYQLKKIIWYTFIASITVGLAIASKLTGILFLFPVCFVFLLNVIYILKGQPRFFLNESLIQVSFALIFVLLSIILGFIFSPYNIVNQRDFQSAVFGYERDVALGKYEAFYTRQFIDTVPVLFQMEKIFPYTLGWPGFLTGFAGMIIFVIYLFLFIYRNLTTRIKLLLAILRRKKKYLILAKPHLQVLLISVSFLSYLIPNVFLYAKWSRFMTPILPFFSLFTGYALFLFYKLIPNMRVKIQKLKFENQKYSSKLKSFNFLVVVLIFAFCILSLLPGMAFMSIYAREDSRVIASRWIYQNIPDRSYILSETANVVDIPLGLEGIKSVPALNVISFDFYHLHENPDLFPQLLIHLENSNYIFIPSRRLFANFTRFPKKFKLTNAYYQLLFSGRLGFEKIAEISSYPTLFLGPVRREFPDEASEETFTVFDHPVIRIYKKVIPKTKSEYEQLIRLYD